MGDFKNQQEYNDKLAEVASPCRSLCQYRHRLVQDA